LIQNYREFSKKLEARLQERLNFIQVVTGPRQVEKTTVFQPDGR
jgi:predicted AAA+ superfamily ATPase